MRKNEKTEAISLRDLPAGKAESPLMDLPEDAVEIKSTLVRDAWPNTSDGVVRVTQFITRDGGTTWEHFGAATFHGRSLDIEGRPIPRCVLAGSRSLRMGDTEVPIPIGKGAKVKVEVECLVPLRTRLDIEARDTPSPIPEGPA